ncbi:hypothetical protein SGPA1_21116 [Streptomyces misionensis JCM 4497]
MRLVRRRADGGCEGSARRGRTARPRGVADAPAGAAARLAAACVRARAVLPGVLRQGGGPPGGLPVARGSRPLPFHHQGGPAGKLPLRDVRGAPGADPPAARLQRDDRAAHPGRVHRQRSVHVGRHGGPLHPGRRRAPR